MVVYVVCYDLSADPQDQHEQLSYWLDFLQSTLGPSAAESHSKWRVVIVGTKLDKSNQSNSSINLIPSWKAQWPHLPLYEKHCVVSSHKRDGIDMLLQELQHICESIFSQHSLRVPNYFKQLQRCFQSISADQLLIHASQFLEPWRGEKLLLALKFLHAVGQIIMLKDGSICPSPQLIPKITAEFVSPKKVRDKLLSVYQVEILDKQQIGAVLEVTGNNKEYFHLLTFIAFYFLVFFFFLLFTF